jgi:hypothetical protein
MEKIVYENKNYKVVVDIAEDREGPSPFNYSVINKDYETLEVRAKTLPHAIDVADNLSSALEEVFGNTAEVVDSLQ